MLDYSGRRPVPKNRPRKQPVGMFVVILVCAVGASFALGVATGWFLRKPAKLPNQQVAGVGDTGAPQTAGGQLANPEAKAPGVDPPLTFYETLPKGGKAIIGSGLNPQKPGEVSISQPPAVVPLPAPGVPQAAVPKLTGPPAAAKPEEQKAAAAPAVAQERKKSAEPPKKVAEGEGAPKQAGGGRFCVQFGSSQDRAEAEGVKAKLVEKGLPAYIVESRVKDKGTWFRVRIGQHLSEQAAGDLAAKAGNRAIVIPE